MLVIYLVNLSLKAQLTPIQNMKKYSLDPRGENNDQGCQSAKENQVWIKCFHKYSFRYSFPFNIFQYDSFVFFFLTYMTGKEKCLTCH